MSNLFSRSWEITKLSFNVIKRDKELLLFPLLAGIFSLLLIAVMIVPTVLMGVIASVADEPGIFEFAVLFMVYLGLAFIATFFNVCVVYTTKKRFEGGNATFGESIKFSMSKIHLIFSWSLLSATVGLILRVIDRMAERAGGAGQIILRITTALIGMAWSIITIFVVPGMVYYNLGPIDAIKKSARTFSKTWGESLIRYLGLGLIETLFIVLGIVVFIPLLILLSNLGMAGIFIALVIGIIYFLAVILIFNVATTVFNTALFVYADKGKIPQGYSKEVMAGAFRRKNTGIGGVV
jgi:hypothetical protein